MAKIYNTKTNEIYWTDSGLYCAIEEAYWELTEMLAVKKLDGHDMKDQWYMAVQRKMAELLDTMEECPFDELAPDLEELV